MKKAIMFGLFILLLSPVTASAETATSTTATSDEVQQKTKVESTEETSEETLASTAESAVESTESTTESTEQEDIDIEKEKDDAISDLEEKTGVKSVPKDEVPDLTTASGIREFLLENPNYDVTKKELKNYTDDQLMNAMTVFDRYNDDFCGMDMGAYVNILRGLYQNHTLSWEKISEQLSFAPESFGTISELISHLDELQTYISVLYPADSSFIAINPISNDELTDIINYCEPIEEKMIATDGSAFPGRIARIVSAVEHGYATTATNASATDGSGTAQGKSSPEGKTPQSSDKSGLPQTGEKRTFFLSALGAVVLLGVAFVFIKRRNAGKRKH